jgi:diacylglycerol kinase (ATP)
LDDGLFDLVFAPEMPLREVLSIVPRLIKGSHLSHPKIFSYRTSSLHIRSQPGTPMHVDGELIADGATTIDYQVLPGKITLLVPKGS